MAASTDLVFSDKHMTRGKLQRVLKVTTVFITLHMYSFPITIALCSIACDFLRF